MVTRNGVARAAAVVAALLASTAASASGGSGGGLSSELGAVLPLWSAGPFVGILLSIALFPLLAAHFWHRHFPKVALAWSLLFALPFLWVFRGEAVHEILHIYLADYVPFIIVLWGLFAVAGGIVVRGTLVGSPGVNTAILAVGTLVASMIGTTGAAILLVRPLLRANAFRRHRVHSVVFFIFLVANVGGSLTPLGDPPLFLGFLHGVPFFWTLKLVPETGLIAAALLALHFVIDRVLWRREDPAAIPTGPRTPVSLAGARNFLFLFGIVAAVLLSGALDLGTVRFVGIERHVAGLLRDVAIVVLGVLSILTTSRALREENSFSWEPIREVAILFAGIFVTIIPAIEILKAGEAGQLAFLVRSVREPAQYFWASGTLSSFLDNAPTYLTFFNTALGQFYPGLPEPTAVARLIAEHGVYLKAISLGAVYMGANTYIGNAPNFMVKSIAEEAGVPMPSFFGYMFRWSIPILIPLFVLITVLFFL